MSNKIIFLLFIIIIFGFTNTKIQKKEDYFLKKNDCNIQIQKTNNILKIAYNEGKKINFSETIQAIVLQESSAGQDYLIGDLQNQFGKRSYGVMQIKLATAKLILKQYFKKYHFRTDEEIIVKLITDPKFNIKIGTRYFKMIYDMVDEKINNKWEYSIAKYNAGHNSSFKNLKYITKIKKRIKTEVKQFNRLMGLS